MEWIDVHGHNHGQYWLLKSDHFHADLDPVASPFTGSVSGPTIAQPATLQVELSLEEVVRRTNRPWFA